MSTRRKHSVEEDDDDFVPYVERKQERRGGKKRKSLGDDSDESSEAEEQISNGGGCGHQKKGKKSNNNNNDTTKKKKRRVRYGWACSMCKLKHRSCDGQRPCTRCKNEGFADTCNDGSGDELDHEDITPKIKEEKPYTAMVKQKGNTCCVKTERSLLENCKKEKTQRPQQPQQSLLSQIQLEREILAKVVEFVALKADALTTNTTPTTSSIMPAFAQILQHPQHPQHPQQQLPQDFSFQFLEPPRWHQPTPSSPSFGLNTYIPSSLYPSPPQLSFASFPSNVFLQDHSHYYNNFFTTNNKEEREKEKEKEKEMETEPGTRNEKEGAEETFLPFSFPTVTNFLSREDKKEGGPSCASVATPPMATYYSWSSTEVEGFLF